MRKVGFDSRAYLSRLMAELDRAAIAVRLKQCREQAGMTQPEMGEALDPPRHWRTIQNYEDPKLGRVPWDALDQWARITGTTKEWLLHGDVDRVTDEERLDALQQELAGVRGELARLARAVEALQHEPEEPGQAASGQ